MSEPYFPQLLFASPSGNTPRVMIAPPRYIQGDGVLDDLGRYLSLLKARRAAVLISKRGLQADGVRILESLKEAGIESVTSIFNGECSKEEITLHSDKLQDDSVDCLIAAGGGKCIDAGKSIADKLGVPVAVVPTLASNDAPCSALSVVYGTGGEVTDVEFFRNNPALVVVDTGVVARASERYLVAGMGDAMATWYEARVCIENPNAMSTIGGRPTLAACAIGEVCTKTLYEEGVAACASVQSNSVTEALEKVVEANTLLSGIGFESGGLAVAHSIAQSYAMIPVVHDNYLHGEMVAMGTLAQVIMESTDEAKRMSQFFAEVGLPIHLGQLSLDASNKDDIDLVVEASMENEMVHNMLMPVTTDLMRSSILGAHELGLSVAAEAGDKAYGRLHES